jgi:hypothetical protein
MSEILSFLSTLAATFIGGWAGSWFAAKATQKQTQVQIDLQAAQRKAQVDLQLKEHAFEFLQVIEEFVAYSFQKEAPIHKSQRDVLSRKLISLCSVLLPAQVKAVENYVWEIRNLHVGKKCIYSFEQTDHFFHDLSKKINTQFFN